MTEKQRDYLAVCALLSFLTMLLAALVSVPYCPEVKIAGECMTYTEADYFFTHGDYE